MSAEQSRAAFETTSWTLIGKLHDESRRREALEEIARSYWPPVYALFRRLNREPQEAMDLTQAFFQEVVLARGLVEGASREAGRLRSLIRTAVRNFDIDQRRRRGARPEGSAVSMEAMAAEEHILAGSSWKDPDDAYDRRWAIDLLQQALIATERNFRDKGKSRNWEAFEARVVRPMVGACAPATLEELRQSLGFANTQDVPAAVQTVKERVKAVLKDVVAHTTSGSDEDAEGEYREILRLLGWTGSS